VKKRRQFNREFKIQVIREVESGTPIAAVGRQHEIHPSLIHKWISQYQSNPEHAFSGPGKAASDEAKIAELQRTIGELYMENAFLKKTLKHLEVQLQRKKVQA
jgi:transposase